MKFKHLFFKEVMDHLCFFGQAGLCIFRSTFSLPGHIDPGHFSAQRGRDMREANGRHRANLALKRKGSCGADFAGRPACQGCRGLRPLPGGAGGGAPRFALRGFQVGVPAAGVGEQGGDAVDHLVGVGEVAVEEQGGVEELVGGGGQEGIVGPGLVDAQQVA